MTTIDSLFATVEREDPLPQRAPHNRYLIAFTPRSGSSYLCERLERTGAVGIPREILNKDLMPTVLQQIPARTPQTYLERVLSVRASERGISGFKTTWHQLVEYTAAMPAGHGWGDYRFIYLCRGDLAAQAVSLYRAVSSNVFHTNIPVAPSARERLESLPYDYAGILHWYRHIEEQETAWEAYFRQGSIEPLRIDYERIHRDIASVLRDILGYLGVVPMPELPGEASIFSKLGGSTSEDWAERFAADHLRHTGTEVRRGFA